MLLYASCLVKKNQTQTQQHIPDYFYVKIPLITPNTEEKIAGPKVQSF